MTQIEFSLTITVVAISLAKMVEARGVNASTGYSGAQIIDLAVDPL